jgi:general secretion pathway protein D
MKKIFSWVIIANLIFNFSCVTKKQSMVQRLIAAKDPIAEMRIPERKGSDKVSTQNEETPESLPLWQNPEQNLAPNSTHSGDVINLNRLSDRWDKSARKIITVITNDVPLRTGPGALYRKTGIAFNGDTFELLKIQPDANGVHTWYLVQDDLGNKVYVSSLLSSISESRGGKGNDQQQKEFARKARKLSLDNNENSKDYLPPIPDDLKKAKFIDLIFQSTEIKEIISMFCDLMKMDYVIEDDVSGRVTLQTFNQVPVEDLYHVIEEILALHNIAVIKSGHFYRFFTIKDAAKKNLNIYFGNDPNIPDRDRPVLHIISLKHVSVEQMENTIRPLLSNQAKFQKIGDTNNVLMVELASNAKRVIKVVEALDVDRMAFADARLFRLMNADSELAVAELEEIFTSLGYGDVLRKSLTFQSLKRMNSILVVNNFENLEPLIEFWIKKLDEPVAEGDTSTFVYQVQNVDATELADLLSSIFKQNDSSDVPKQKSSRFERKRADPTDKAGKRGAPRKVSDKIAENTKKGREKIRDEVKNQLENGKFEGDIDITPDKTTNSLIIRTGPRNYNGILEIIKKLDLFPQQVLIEVLIMDMIIDDETLAGMEWAIQGQSGDTTIRTGNRSSSNGLATLGSGAVSSLLSGGSFSLFNPGNLAVLIRALAADSKAEILPLHRKFRLPVPHWIPQRHHQ